MKTLAARRLRILASRVFDSTSGIFLVNQAITVSRVTGLIIDVRPISALEDVFEDGKIDVIDLLNENITLIPGLIDTHVHCEPLSMFADARNRLLNPKSLSSILTSLFGDLLG